MMKKLLRCIALALVCWLLLAGTALAAAKIDLAIDGVVVPTERTEENITNFYLETRPQMRGNSVFVPVRVVSEILGAQVVWADPNINIKFGETEIVLTVGSRAAYQDGKKITLPAAPYERGGYTYVPIRFVAEAFDCDVEWQAKKNLVNIKTKPWELNGQAVTGIANEIQMTARNYIFACQSPYQAQKIYQVIMDNLGDEVIEPEPYRYGKNINQDPPYYYFEDRCFYFLNEKSTFLDAWENEELTGFYACEVKDYIQALKIYIRLCGDSDTLPEGYTVYLAEIGGRWYALDGNCMEQLSAWLSAAEWRTIAVSSDRSD